MPDDPPQPRQRLRDVLRDLPQPAMAEGKFIGVRITVGDIGAGVVFRRYVSELRDMLKSGEVTAHEAAEILDELLDAWVKFDDV